MKTNILLSTLDKVRKSGPHSWVACCPAHADKSPSLTITETDDGRVLVHCFAGCDTESVLGAVGLTFDDLFPESPGGRKPERMPFNPRDVLAAVSKEALIVALCASDMAKGRHLTPSEHQRLIQATGRIKQAAEICHAI